jgi:catechol 2,3-dioxygenase-like lactoylglutathione lyase family enzyme
MEGLEIEGALTFFYYKEDEIEEAFCFYSDVMKFELMMERDWVKLFRIHKSAHIGLVRADKGSHKPNPVKPVRLQIMVDDADAWFQYLKERGVELDRESPHVGAELNIKAFSVKDPEGYTVEICEYTTPYGEYVG